ncbi:MAG: hypothetical protein KatS3mg031_0995 [Chitinophagales bacterium]|nr:MAG: hypothetical protein KatS3mg031_0995 [Chitinophagales bacterium]
MLSLSLRILLLTLVSLSAAAQTGVVKGKVLDAKSGEALVGVNVVIDTNTGTTTDIDGHFTLQMPPGNYTVRFSYLGYSEISVKAIVKENATTDLGTITLTEALKELNIVTVTGSKFERQIAREVSTIEVLKSDFIQSTNSVTLAEAVNKVPGVTLIDNQPAIRGGSGYAYGVGSRVLVLLDDIPMITADRGDVRWNYLPIELIEQVEILKASSSALYGASALNGVINTRTKFPRAYPETSASIYYHIYGDPRNDSMKWWGKPTAVNIAEPDDPKLPRPQRYGGFFSHSHRIKQFDVIIGAAVEKERGYIRLLDQQFIRASGKFRHRPMRIERLTYGLNFYCMDSRETDFFFWKNSVQGAYVPAGSNDYDEDGTLVSATRQNVTLDPYVSYMDRSDGRHLLRLRYNRLAVQFSVNYPVAHILQSEYQYQKSFKRIASITAGINDQFYIMQDRDLQNHNLHIGAVYGQVDLEFKKLTISAGGRAEIFKLDERGDTSAFTFKIGLNYQPARYTYLRLSAGTGYRYPAIAEFFAVGSLGEVNGIKVRVIGNPDLVPEYGGSGELGIKQGFRIKQWLGYFDFAFFWQEYKEMIEFVFGIHKFPDGTQGLGFRSENISRARVAGFEASILGEGKFGQVPFRMLGGYTYVYPVELMPEGGDSSLNNVGNYLRNFFRAMGNVNEEILDGLLRYRYRHTFKADMEVDLRHFILGSELHYYSFMDKIDPFIEFIATGLSDFRQRAQERTITGDFLWNLRAGYDFQRYGKLMFIVNNVLNRVSAIRPAKMDPPVNFVIQYSINIKGQQQQPEASLPRPE